MAGIGIIPAAGKGTRVGLPYPKELLPVTWESLHEQQYIVTVIESNLDQLSAAGISQAVVVVNHDKEIIREYLGDRRRGVDLQYAYQHQKHSKEGLPDAIAAAYHLVQDYTEFVMLMGDVYLQHEPLVKELLSFVAKFPQAAAGLALWHTQEPWRFGVVTAENFYVNSVVDKPKTMEPSRFWGAVVFRQNLWPYIFDEDQTFSHVLHRAIPKDVVAMNVLGEYYDLGTPASYIEAIKKVNP